MSVAYTAMAGPSSTTVSWGTLLTVSRKLEASSPYRVSATAATPSTITLRERRMRMPTAWMARPAL
jgi:hypothetical protein